MCSPFLMQSTGDSDDLINSFNKSNMPLDKIDSWADIGEDSVQTRAPKKDETQQKRLSDASEGTNDTASMGSSANDNVVIPPQSAPSVGSLTVNSATGCKRCTPGKKCIRCCLTAGVSNSDTMLKDRRRRPGDPEWLKARRRLSNRRDSPVLLRLLEEIRQAQASERCSKLWRRSALPMEYELPVNITS